MVYGVACGMVCNMVDCMVYDIVCALVYGAVDVKVYNVVHGTECSMVSGMVWYCMIW